MNSVRKSLSKEQKQALKILKQRLETKDYDEKSLYEDFRNICEETKVGTADFFKAAYLVLLNKERGPKLAGFIMLIGKEKVVKILEQI